MNENKAVFLDKDGTLIEDVPFSVDPARMRLTPRAAEGLRLLHAAGFLIIVVSNQAGVARGHFPEGALGAVENRLAHLLADEAGVPLAGFYYCPHDPDGTLPAYTLPCFCRKPAPGLLLRAAQKHHVDLSRSWLVGDILDDIQAGRSANCMTVLLNRGNETQWRLSAERRPHYVAFDLYETARIITGVSSSPDPLPRSPEVSNG